MHNPTSCSAVARADGASLPGTAPYARAYLLVAFAGPWPTKPFEQITIDPVAGQMIADRASAAGVKPLFIRRPDSAYAPHQRQFEWAYVDAATRTTTWHQPATLAQIARVPWPDAASASRAPSDQPFYLVCTHGRRDQCCATRGRPVAASFAAVRTEQTWECSHVGGHRFASVVVTLPAGDIYGMVEPEDVPSIVSAADRGAAHLPRLRGSSLDEPPVQVAKAEVMAAHQFGEFVTLTAGKCERIDEATWLVELTHRDTNHAHVAPWQVVVRRRAANPAPASCGKAPESGWLWSAEVTAST